MIGKLWRQWQAGREQAALRRRAIPDDLWKRTLVRYPFLQRRDPATAAELRRLTSLFLDRKEFSTAGGLVLTDAMVVAIAAQAVLPVLRIGLEAYSGFVGIVVHPDKMLARRSEADEDGVVHEYDLVLDGETHEGGPVVLSWRDVRLGTAEAARERSAYNVVIHEFAHVLDGLDGSIDGVPPLPAGLTHREWTATLQAGYARFVQQVEAGEPGVIDPYGTEGLDEFFPVASEAFFVSPQALQIEQPALYALFARLYGQDPAAEMPPQRRG